MQNMRRLILSLLIAAFNVYCSDFSVVTWNLEWFPSGSSKGFASKEIESQRIVSVAQTLSKLNCDIIIIEEVRDITSCEQLVEALKPLKYTVSICTQFKDAFGGGVGFSTSSSEVQKYEVRKTMIQKSLKQQFNPEFLNRIDDIILFNSLTKTGFIQKESS